MGLGALIIYGVGDMLGAGVYGLMGKYAGKMGNAIWLAFAFSMLAAIFTGLSYASLGSRYPRAAGAAFITHRAFNKKFLSYAIGLTICASGLTSFATQSRAFAGYLLGFRGYTIADVSPLFIFGLAAGFILFLTLVNFWGMKEATWVNALCTAIEVGGLALIITVGFRYIGGVNLFEVPAPIPAGSPEGTQPTATTLGALGLAGMGTFALQGAILTFYSFIGFEDMINVSEEVKDPQRTFPKGVVYALIITAIIYALVAIVAISVVPWRELSTSTKPMVDVMAIAAPWFPSWAFGAIAMFAIANTALLNYIMGSRIIYGMARQGFLPNFLSAIHPKRQTPHIAILALMGIALLLVLVGDISALAAATSTLLLFIFIVVNASLIALKRRANEPKGFFEVPTFVPVGGILVSLMMITAAAFDPDRRPSFTIALGLVAFITVLYFIMRPKEITEETLTAVESG
jgi:APA family basic amino acid/polyamine antiporter